jgi:hypothetical protein
MKINYGTRGIHGRGRCRKKRGTRKYANDAKGRAVGIGVPPIRWDGGRSDYDEEDADDAADPPRRPRRV